MKKKKNKISNFSLMVNSGKIPIYQAAAIVRDDKLILMVNGKEVLSQRLVILEGE